MYDPDVGFVRSLELFHATRPTPAPPLTVYFAAYDNSAEHQRYKTALHKETQVRAPWGLSGGYQNARTGDVTTLCVNSSDLIAVSVVCCRHLRH